METKVLNLCSVCLQSIGLKVRYPQLLKSIKWCDHCKSKRCSLDVMEVVKLSLAVKG